MSMTSDHAALIRDIADFPSPGIVFKDITPLLGDPAALAGVTQSLADPFAGEVDKVVGIEALGFILATPVALRLGAGFVPMRKAGKLPSTTVSRSYDLEYGSATLEIHDDAFAEGDRVLIVDDVLATGGTAAAAVELVQEAGGTVVGLAFLIELTFLNGGGPLGDLPRTSLISY